MKRIALCVTAVVLAACQDAPTSAPGTRPSLDVTTFTEDFIVPVAYERFVECANGGAGELVSLSGHRRHLVHVTANDNTFTARSHVQPFVSGAGLTTGERYLEVGVVQSTTIEHTWTGSATGTEVRLLRLIGQGAGANLYVRLTHHYTFSASGDVTVDFEDLRVECQ